MPSKSCKHAKQNVGGGGGGGGGGSLAWLGFFFNSHFLK